MKKTVYNLFFLALAMVCFTACKKTLEEKYTNPEQSGEQNIPAFFTAMLNNDRVRPSYYHVRTFLMPQTAVYSKTASFVNENDVFKPSDSYTGKYWSDFYYPGGTGSGPLATYRQMQTTYAALSSGEQAAQRIFMEAGKVALIDQAAQMVDLWGDIPYTEAGSLETSNTIKNPNFDDAKTLYTSFINELDSAATYFASATTSSSFTKQDILLLGSTDRWRRYANSLRLRLLMRISFSDEAAARTAVTAMLADPAGYPLLDGNNTAAYNPASYDVLLRPLSTNNATLRDALTELRSYPATDEMLNKVMLPANDPRIPVMYDKFGTTVNGTFVPNKTYRAMPSDYTSGQADTAYTHYAILDSVTFLSNKNIPGIVFTSAEVNFLKAEAFERWGGGDARTAYETAVQQAVYFMYYLNGLSQETALTPPDMTAFLAAENVAYTGTQTDKLAKIWTQKWLNFGFLQSTHAWAEYRRTKYPVLSFSTAGKLSGYETPPARLIYPIVETGYNPNYEKVRAKDTRSTKIFWDVK